MLKWRYVGDTLQAIAKASGATFYMKSLSDLLLLTRTEDDVSVEEIVASIFSRIKGGGNDEPV